MIGNEPHRIRILLADDDADDRLLFETIYAERKDIDLLGAAINGVQVIEKLNAIKENINLPDLIILDQNMPLMTGKQTLSLLKADPRFVNIPVCIYSTYADQSLIGDCKKLGAAKISSKPITDLEYQHMLDEFLATVGEDNVKC